MRVAVKAQNQRQVSKESDAEAAQHFFNPRLYLMLLVVLQDTKAKLEKLAADIATEVQASEGICAGATWV